VGNVKAFFSGHYQTYGINVQAACDSNCKFVSVCIAALGGSNNITAFRKTPLAGIVANKIPVGKCIVGDNAYTCCKHLLTPFAGKWHSSQINCILFLLTAATIYLQGEQKHDPIKDTYNFYLSQLPIRIEMTFGILTSKWCILRRPLQGCVKHAGKIFFACARLHNFIIDLEGGAAGVANSDAASTAAFGIVDDSDDFHFFPSDVGVLTVPGNSLMWDILVDRMNTMALLHSRALLQVVSVLVVHTNLSAIFTAPTTAPHCTHCTHRQDGCSF
jgi:hypothetical protein